MKLPTEEAKDKKEVERQRRRLKRLAKLRRKFPMGVNVATPHDRKSNLVQARERLVELRKERRKAKRKAA